MLCKQNIAESRTESRGDFIDRMKEIKEAGILSEDHSWSQGIGFFRAGFETSSNNLSTLIYNLAKHPRVQVTVKKRWNIFVLASHDAEIFFACLNIQEKIYLEVQEVLAKYQGRIDHDTIASMPYTEAALQENLRLYPPVTR